MKFQKYGDINRIQQTFDKEKIFITKMGKKINCYDAIQAANIDTDIYEVMKKYHCQEDTAMELMQERGGVQGIYSDITELQKNIKDFGDIKKVTEYAQQQFDQLPAEIKQKYGNNLELFMQEMAKKTTTTEPKTETKTETATENKTEEKK